MTETAQPDRRRAGDRGARSVVAGWQLHSMHRTSRGIVTYASGPCGAWLVLLDGKPLATSGLPLSTGKGDADDPGSWPDRGEVASTSPSLDVDPFDRMLLTTDGTVTSQLEALTGEPIVTRTTRQAGPATLDLLLAVTGPWWRADTGLVELAPTEQLIARRVTLRGGRSGTPYVLADSLVVPDRLPGVNAERLRLEGASLGRLLAVSELETRREVLRITTERAGAASGHLCTEPSTTLACRTYRIMVRQRAAAVVTEWLVPGRLATAALRGHQRAGRVDPSEQVRADPPRRGGGGDTS
jgi:chorismate-pyruvate lyase